MQPAEKGTNNSGQALLIVLLSMAVVLTVVLSIIASSFTDINLTSREEDSMRAFSAAEAGIEKALITGSSTASELDGASFSTTITSAALTTDFIYPYNSSAGETNYFWFVSHDGSGNEVCSQDNPCFYGNKFKVCWGKSGASDASPNTPAIEGSLFYLDDPSDVSSLRIARFTADPDSARRSNNFFSATDIGPCTIDETTFQFQKIINLADLSIPASVYNTAGGLRYMKIRFFYNNDIPQSLALTTAVDGFSGSNQLPGQGQSIVSSGSAGSANRKIEVFKGFLEFPDIFDSVVYDIGGGVTKVIKTGN